MRCSPCPYNIYIADILDSRVLIHRYFNESHFAIGITGMVSWVSCPLQPITAAQVLNSLEFMVVLRQLSLKPTQRVAGSLTPYIYGADILSGRFQV